MKMYSVEATLTNEFGRKILHAIIEGTDPDDVCWTLTEQIRGINPPTEVKIFKIDETDPKETEL